MTVFLLILKIIGITLLVIISLILLILLAILFVPLRYKIKGHKGKADGDILAEVKVTWLLHFLNILVRYRDELFYRVRITLITIKSSVEKEKKRRRKVRTKKEKPKKEESKTEHKQIEEKKDDELEETINSYESEISEQSIYEVTTSEHKIDTEEIPDESDDKLSFFEKIEKFVNAVIDFIVSIDNRIKEAACKVKDMYENIEYYSNFVNDEKNKEALSFVLDEVSKVLKNIKPRRFKGYFHFGFDNPETTGKVFSILGILYPVIQDKIEIDGTFDEEVLEGDLMLSGRITVFVIIKVAWKLYFNKNLRRALKEFKRED
ncbi:MAG: hypothetical protein Q4E51_02025 [Lachnospiraceae bacterium]|nr:hypothetical protein [Lachnospiraceae bacterium]